MAISDDTGKIPYNASMGTSYVRVILHHEDKFLIQRGFKGQENHETVFLEAQTAVVPSFQFAKQHLSKETGIGDVMLVNTTAYLNTDEHLFSYLLVQTVSYRPPDFSQIDLKRFTWVTLAELQQKPLSTIDYDFVHKSLGSKKTATPSQEPVSRRFAGLGRLTYSESEQCWRGKHDFSGVFIEIAVHGDVDGVSKDHAQTMRQRLQDLTAVYRFGLEMVEELATRMAWFANNAFLNWEFKHIKVLDKERPLCYTLHYYEYDNDIYGNWVVFCEDEQRLFAKRTQT